MTRILHPSIGLMLNGRERSLTGETTGQSISQSSMLRRLASLSYIRFVNRIVRHNYSEIFGRELNHFLAQTI